MKSVSLNSKICVSVGIRILTNNATEYFENQTKLNQMNTSQSKYLHCDAKFCN